LESEPRTVAWILYAVAIAAGRAPAALTDISTAADAVNHAVPTHRELSNSLEWLVARGLVESAGRFHRLTPAGRALFEQSQESTSTVSQVWANLARGIQSISGGA
jgi:hypothetical protein